MFSLRKIDVQNGLTRKYSVCVYMNYMHVLLKYRMRCAFFTTEGNLN